MLDGSRNFRGSQAQPGGVLPSAEARSLHEYEKETNEGEKDPPLSWSDLPEGPLHLVASSLAVRDTAAARLVCCRWSRSVAGVCTRLQVKGRGPERWGELFCGLEELLWASPCLEQAVRLPKLRTLLLEGAKLRDAHLLKRLTRLRSLSLQGCVIMDAAMKGLRELTALTSLDMRYCYPGGPGNVTDAGLEGLGELRALASLNLEQCNIMTDARLKDLRQLTALTSLNLSHCGKITDAGLKELGQLRALASLNLGHCYNITDIGLKDVIQLKSITSLDVEGCYNITDASLKDLGHLTKLTSLNVGCCSNITNAGLKELGQHLTNLSSLNLWGCSKITVKGIRELQHLPGLKIIFRL